MTSVAEPIRRPRSIRPWPLALADHLVYPKLMVAGSVAALASAYFAVSGTWFPEQYPPHWSSSLQVTGMAITFTLIVTYLAGFMIFSAEKSMELIEELRPHFASPLADSLVSELNRVDPLRFLAATGAGVVLGSFNVSWAVVRQLASQPDWPIDLAMVLGSMGVWIFSAQVIYSRAHNAFLLSRLGREAIAVDLFRPKPLDTFARIGIIDILLVAGVLALTPIQALDAEFRSYNYFFAFLVGLPTGLFLLVSPMWGIHQRLRAEKKRALGEVDALIAAAGREMDDAALIRLNELVARRQYLEGVHQWPMNFRSIARVGFYFVIPPLAWVGAALVEIFLESALHDF